MNIYCHNVRISLQCMKVNIYQISDRKIQKTNTSLRKGKNICIEGQCQFIEFHYVSEKNSLNGKKNK